MSFRQTWDLTSKIDTTLPPWLQTVVRQEIQWDQGRVRGEKCIVWKFWECHILIRYLAAAALLFFFGPAGGRSLRARVCVMLAVKLVETMCLLRRCPKAILFSARRSIAEMATWNVYIYIYIYIFTYIYICCFSCRLFDFSKVHFLKFDDASPESRSDIAKWFYVAAMAPYIRVTGDLSGSRSGLLCRTCMDWKLPKRNFLILYSCSCGFFSEHFRPCWSPLAARLRFHYVRGMACRDNVSFTTPS